MITLEAAAAKLGHPMGNRATDPQLAQAVLTGGLGRRPSVIPPAAGSLTEGLRQYQPGAFRRAWSALRAAVVGPRTSRRWYLRRAEQLDQGNTPQCVAFTAAHWQRSLPVHGMGHDPDDLYDLAKQIDGWPGEDGTSGSAMLEVCQTLGLVASHWWWTGSQDDEAARRWLLDVGPCWWGAGWSESMFRTDLNGLVTVTGSLQYGHETLIIGRTPNFKGLGPAVEGVNSWGNTNYGVLGRFWILERDFFGRLMPEGGDLVGVVEQR